MESDEEFHGSMHILMLVLMRLLLPAMNLNKQVFKKQRFDLFPSDTAATSLKLEWKKRRDEKQH